VRATKGPSPSDRRGGCALRTFWNKEGPIDIGLTGDGSKNPLKGRGGKKLIGFIESDGNVGENSEGEKKGS
jgi:hypothetical protein